MNTKCTKELESFILEKCFQDLGYKGHAPLSTSKTALNTFKSKNSSTHHIHGQSHTANTEPIKTYTNVVYHPFYLTCLSKKLSRMIIHKTSICCKHEIVWC